MIRRKNSKQWVDGHIELTARYEGLRPDGVWRVTAISGLSEYSFTARDHKGEPNSIDLMLGKTACIEGTIDRLLDIHNLITAEPLGESRFLKDMTEREIYVAVLRNHYNTASTISKISDEPDSLRNHVHFDSKMTSIFKLGYLYAEFIWKFQHERDALRGKNTVLSASIGGEQRSLHGARAHLYSEIGARLDRGEKLSKICINLVVRDEIAINARSLERSYRRWLNKNGTAPPMSQD